MRKPRGVGFRRDIADDHKRAGLNGSGHRISVGHGDSGIGVDDPDGFHTPIRHGAEHIHRLQSRLFSHRGAGPEALHSVAVALVFNIEMAGEHIGQAANLAPAHRIRLACDRKRPHAGAPDAARGKVAVDDRIDLIAAGGGLVDALAIDRHHLFGAAPQIDKLQPDRLLKARFRRDRWRRRR